jgi:hypothetical protein
MRVAKIRTHICGFRNTNPKIWPCTYRNQIGLMEISLEFPGRLPVQLIRWEIARLTRKCDAESTERIFCNAYDWCADCLALAESLGAEEVARRVKPR